MKKLYKLLIASASSVISGGVIGFLIYETARTKTNREMLFSFGFVPLNEEDEEEWKKSSDVYFLTSSEVSKSGHIDKNFLESNSVNESEKIPLLKKRCSDSLDKYYEGDRFNKEFQNLSIWCVRDHTVEDRFQKFWIKNIKDDEEGLKLKIEGFKKDKVIDYSGSSDEKDLKGFCNSSLQITKVSKWNDKQHLNMWNIWNLTLLHCTSESITTPGTW